MSRRPQASRNPWGYGWFMLQTPTRRPHLAHRVAWTLSQGEIPDGLQVLHRCDNPPCVNPAHLFLGTQEENVADMGAKGRARGHSAPGESNPMAKLTWEQAEEIRRAYAAGEGSYKTIGQRYGVHAQTVCDIVRGRRWLVPEP